MFENTPLDDIPEDQKPPRLPPGLSSHERLRILGIKAQLLGLSTREQFDLAFDEFACEELELHHDGLFRPLSGRTDEWPRR